MKYPFLPQARRQIIDSELDYSTLAESPRVRERAKQRVKLSFEPSPHFSLKDSRDRDIDTEIASFALAVLYVAGVSDHRLTERFALHEAQQINRYLGEERREEVLLEVAKAFAWDTTFEKGKTESRISVSFSKYLENTTKGKLAHVSKWKLVNRPLDRGRVLVNPYELARLLQVEVEERVRGFSNQELTNVPQELQGDINEIKTSFLNTRPKIEEFDQMVRAEESEYPPCVNAFMKRAVKGEHLSHVERFTLVTYLLAQGISVDSIVSLFSNVSDFNESKTRYQVENLAGKTGGRTEPYKTYNCDTLQTHGVCLNREDPICLTIRNPLTYHLRKQKRRIVQPTKGASAR